MLEAKKYNLKIVASELDYVRDIVDPVETFNPDSAISIARSIKRFLNIKQNKFELKSPSEVWDQL